MKMILVALALAAGVLGAAAHTAQAAIPAVVRMASDAAGRPVVIQCDSAESVRSETAAYALAYVVLDGSSVIHLGPTACGWLAYPKSPTYGEALLVVIHEAMHLRYVSVDEAATECRAMRAFGPLALRYFPRANHRMLAWGAGRIDSMMADGYRGGVC
jgi:hypothetical protein